MTPRTMPPDPQQETPSWITTLRDLSSALLEEGEPEDSLMLAAQLVELWVDADATLVFLPSLGDNWACEFTTGEGTGHFVGLPFLRSGELDALLSTGRGQIILDIQDSPLSQVADFSAFEASLIAPLSSPPGQQTGAVIVLRRRGREAFEATDLELVDIGTQHMVLALHLAEGRGAQERAILLEERERISRDLHDYVIQEIFGAGIGLDRLRAQAKEETLSSAKMVDGLKVAMKSLEDAVLQIRRIVYTLHEPSPEQLFTEMLEEETSRARTILGFAPSLVLEFDGFPVVPNSPRAREQVDELCSRISESIASDAAATVREALSNIARHAQARSATVNVSVSGHGIIGELVVSVVDDGVGADPPADRTSGIDNMGRRATLHGGSFAMGAGPRGRGTSLVWRVPLG